MGHPFFDECDVTGRSRAGGNGVDQPHVLLLPGSRGQEIDANLGTILAAAVAVRRQVPEARFSLAALHERHAARAREAIAASAELRALGIDVSAGRARDLITTADAALAVSGSVSLELLASRVPTVIVYRIGGFDYVVQSFFRRARFITLVNLLACREPIGPVQRVLVPPRSVPPADPEAVFPEYLAVGDPVGRMAGHVTEWLQDPAAMARTRARIEAVAARVAHPGSAARAAAAVLAIAGGAAPQRAVARQAA